MSREIEHLARQVAEGNYDAFPELFRQAARARLIPTAGPLMVVIRSKRSGEFWTGGRRQPNWDRNRAQTYINTKTARGPSKAAKKCDRVLHVEPGEVEALLPYSDFQRDRPDGKVAVWIQEPVQIATMLPIEIRVEDVDQ